MSRVSRLIHIDSDHTVEVLGEESWTANLRVRTYDVRKEKIKQSMA